MQQRASKQWSKHSAGLSVVLWNQSSTLSQLGTPTFLMLVLLKSTFPLRQHFSRSRFYLLLRLLCCGGLDGEHRGGQVVELAAQLLARLILSGLGSAHSTGIAEH